MTPGLVEQLRTAIVRGALRPNQRLVEADLAASLRVSRTPIREALSRLAADRLVTSDRRGWIVREHGAREIQEIFESRIALEGYASYLGASRRDASDIEMIGAALTDEQGLLSGDRNRRVDANNRFHDLIVRAAKNDLLAELIARARLYYFNYQLAALYSGEELRLSQSQHVAIADAVRRSDPAAAERHTREHISTSMRAAMEKLQPHETGLATLKPGVATAHD